MFIGSMGSSHDNIIPGRLKLYNGKNYQALRCILDWNESTGRLARWTFRLAEFDFEVAHPPGKYLNATDAMYRVP